jgi:hypothetical protein
MVVVVVVVVVVVDLIEIIYYFLNKKIPFLFLVFIPTSP